MGFYVQLCAIIYLKIYINKLILDLETMYASRIWLAFLATIFGKIVFADTKLL